MLGISKPGIFILIWVTIFCCFQAPQVESWSLFGTQLKSSEETEDNLSSETTTTTIPSTTTTTIAPTTKATSTATTTLSFPIIPSSSPPPYIGSGSSRISDNSEEVKTEKPKKTSTTKTSTTITSTAKTTTPRRSRSRSRSSTKTETPAANLDSDNSDNDDTDKHTSEENREMIRKYKIDEGIDEDDGDSAPKNKMAKINYSSSPSSSSEAFPFPDASAPTAQAPNSHPPNEKKLEEQYVERHRKNIYKLYHETEFEIYILTHATLLKAQNVINDINRDLSRLLGQECRDHMHWFKPMHIPPSENSVISNHKTSASANPTPSGSGSSSGSGTDQDPGCEAEKACLATQNSLDLQILSLEKLILENKKFREESIDYRKRSIDFHTLYSQSLRNTLGNYTASEREKRTLSSYLPVGDEPVGVARGDDASSSNDNFKASKKDSNNFGNSISEVDLDTTDSGDTSQILNTNKKSKINFEELDDIATATSKKPKSKTTPSINSIEFIQQRYPPASSRSRKDKTDQRKTKTDSRSGSSSKFEIEDVDDDENEIFQEIKTEEMKTTPTTLNTPSTTPTSADAATTKTEKIILTTTPENTTTTAPTVTTLTAEAKVSEIKNKAAGDVSDEATKAAEPLEASSSSLLMSHLNIIDQISDAPKRIEKYKEIISATIKAGFSFNSDIFQVASHVKNTQNLSTQLTADLKQSFPIPVQIVVWGDVSKLKMKSEVSMFKLYANQDNELKSQKLKHHYGSEREANLDGDAWKFLPLPLSKTNDGDVFALLNVRSKSAVTITQREDEINHARQKIVLEDVTARNISMLPASFGWKLSLICDYAAVEKLAKNLEESGKTLSRDLVPVNGYGKPAVSVSEVTPFDKSGHCPKGAWLVTMDNVGERAIALDVHQTGTVYLGDAGNGGRFQLHT